VAHDDRRTVEALDDLAEMVKCLGNGCLGDDLGLSRSASTSISNPG